MARNLLILITLVLASYIGTKLYGQRPPVTVMTAADPVPFDPVAVPAFTARTLDNTPISVSRHGDKIVLINFWATWCAPCLIEFPRLVALAKEYPDKLTLLALSHDTHTEHVTRFLKQYDLPENFVVGMDIDKDIARRFGTLQIPETYVIHDNHIIDKMIGAHWSKKQITRHLDMNP